MERKRTGGEDGKGIPERGNSLYKGIRNQVTSSLSFCFPLIHLAHHCCNSFHIVHCTALISFLLTKCSWILIEIRVNSVLLNWASGHANSSSKVLRMFSSSPTRRPQVHFHLFTTAHTISLRCNVLPATLTM